MAANLRALTQRPELPGDEPLLLELYASTRADELDAAGFPASLRASFLASQFKAQQLGYRNEFPRADFQIILLHHQPVGRCVVHRAAEAIQLVDLVLLPAHQNAGIGAALLKQLAAEAAAAKKPLRLKVFKGNPRAARLYLRLGFRKVGESGLHDEMEWRDPRTP